MKIIFQVLILLAGSVHFAHAQADTASKIPSAAIPAKASVPARPVLPERPDFGIGISQGNVGGFSQYFGSTSSPENVLYLSLNAPGAKFEPEFSYRRQALEEGDAVETSSIWRLGVGIFARNPHGPVDVYFGARAGLLLRFNALYIDDEEADSDSDVNMYVGPVAGGEYFLAGNFSLGGEAQLIYTLYGSQDLTTESSPDVSTWDTRGHIFLRWYL